MIDTNEIYVILLNGPIGCVDGDTEYFTKDGWVKFKNYNDNHQCMQYDPETGLVSFADTKFIHGEAVNMYKVESKAVDMVLSANHRVLYETSRGNMKVKEFGGIAESIMKSSHGFSGKIPTTFKTNGSGIGITDDELRLMVAMNADGYKITNSVGNHAFNLKKVRKKERLEKILNCTDYKWKPYTFDSMPGYTRYKIYNYKLNKGWDWEFVLNCSSHQLEVIAEELPYWDGDLKRKVFTSIKKEAEIFQYIFHATGSNANISVDRRAGKECFTVYKSNKSKIGLEGAGISVTEFEPDNKSMYCVTVPSSFFVARRNGKIFITGNSGKDHIADVLCKRLGWNKEMFKKELYKETAKRFNVDLDWLIKVATDRNLKELPMDELEGFSPRGAMIHRSENEIKPEFGKGYFGEKTFDNLKKGVNVISDSGFLEEAVALINKGIPARNILHVKLYRVGCEFSSNDSRNYFDMTGLGVPTATFQNDGELLSDGSRSNLTDETIVGQFMSVVINNLKWKI